MKIFLFLLTFLNLALITTSFGIENLQRKINYSVIILGDSITDGYGIEVEKAYPALLQNMTLDDKELKNIKIIPSAISGSVTASAHSRLQWLINNEKNIIGVIVALGGNDLLRGIKPDTVEKNYIKLIELAKNEKIPLLFATIPVPMNYENFQKDLDFVYLRLSKNSNVTILPNFLKGVVGVPKLNQTDGIHPNELGHMLIAKNVYEPLKSWIKKIRKLNGPTRSK